MSPEPELPPYSSIRILPDVIARGRLEARALIAGFHGIGATGYWTVKFLIQELKARRVCYIDSEFAPAVSSTVKNEISTPYEVYGVGDLLLLKAEVPPLRENETRFFRELSTWIMGSGIKEVTLIGGLDESLRTDDSRYRLVLTDAMKAGDRGRGLEAEPILEEGRMIVGPVAIMINAFQMRGFPAEAILSYSNTERIDPRAAATAVEFIAKRYSLQVNTEPLIKGAEELERELVGMAQRERDKGGPSGAIYS
ncbi:MAG TPA: PAC2 family protein [Nitrososphaerales archaeon]|nr:PAC2 family protein [Nitrososphaerales archaeon]